MWRVLSRQGRADLFSHRLSSLMMVLVVAVATTGIVGGIAAQRGASDRWDAVFAEANGAHVTFQFDGTVPADALASDAAVSEASPPFTTALDVRRVLGDLSLSDEAFGLAAASPQPPVVGRPVVRTGHWLTGADAELVLDRSVALDWGLDAGDSISLTGPAAAFDADGRRHCRRHRRLLLPGVQPGVVRLDERRERQRSRRIEWTSGRGAAGPPARS